MYEIVGVRVKLEIVGRENKNKHFFTIVGDCCDGDGCSSVILSYTTPTLSSSTMSHARPGNRGLHTPTLLMIN